MPRFLINRLHFRTNAVTILKHLQSRHPGNTSPQQFSFNSLRLMPEALNLDVNQPIQRLSLMNSDLSVFNQTVNNVVLSETGYEDQEKQSPEKIQDAIEMIRRSLASSESSGLPNAQVFEQAVTNYQQYNFFSQIDWRLAHWGTVEDVCSVVEATFDLPTDNIVFETQWTPPIAAIQFLANTFPSVRFELFYHYDSNEPWTKAEFFPTVPFGY